MANPQAPHSTQHEAEIAADENTPLVSQPPTEQSRWLYLSRDHNRDRLPRRHDGAATHWSRLPAFPSRSRDRYSRLKSTSYGSQWFQSWKRPSRSLSMEPSSQLSRAHREPLIVFKDLLDLLLSHNVPGPMLFRVRTEFSNRLGSGRTFEVFGASAQLLSLDGLSRTDSTQSVTQDAPDFTKAQKTLSLLPKVAIKRAYVDDNSSSRPELSTSVESVTRAFGHQLVCVEREILNLCHSDLRDHPNIIKLLGWGLCLDTLEATTAFQPRIPLLIVERATSTLSILIGRRAFECFCNSTCPGHQAHIDILKDVGRGLDAIHNAGLVHGDIKLDNILIFDNGAGITAKLSDFGLTVAAAGESGVNVASEYRGTPRWCPPPGSARHHARDLYAFDYFAYGLVTWCVFATRTRSPLPDDDEINANIDGPFAPSRLFDTVISDVFTHHSEIPLAVTMVLRSCLHDNPRFWRKRPWKILEGSLFFQSMFFGTGLDSVPHIFGKISLSLVPRTIHPHIVLSKCGRSALGIRYRLRRIGSLFSLRSTKLASLLSRFSFVQRRQNRQSKRGKLMEQLSRQAVGRISYYIDPDLLNPLEHSADMECWDFGWLTSDLACRLEELPSSLQPNNSGSSKALRDQIYAMARFRSRIPLCCFRMAGNAQSCLKLALERRCSLSILAWLCNGDIGKYEVSTLDSTTLSLWLAGLKRKRPSTARQTADIVMRLILLAESGCRLDYAITLGIETKSILRIMLEVAYGLKSDIARMGFINCITCLQRRSLHDSDYDSIPPALRYFLSGRGLPDRLGESSELENFDCWTTALHECIKTPAYDAVEALLIGGFDVNALDAQGETALQCAIIVYSKEPDHEGDSLETDRIIGLLRQSPTDILAPNSRDKHWRNTSSSLIGWGVIHLRKVPRQASISVGTDGVAPRVKAYLDRHFNSITLKRPTFSFFSDQRLALGFRKVDLPGQTYYLDLLRFIRPSPVRSSAQHVEWTFSQAWYDAEAAQSDASGAYTWKDSLQVRIESLRIASTRTFASFLSVYQKCKSKIFPISIPFGIGQVIGRLLLPGQPLNIYLLCVPLALIAGNESWSPSIKLTVNLFALASLANLCQTSMLVFTGLESSGNLIDDLTKMLLGFVVVPLCSTHVELFCLVHMIMQDLHPMIIPFILATITWNFQSGVLMIAFNFFKMEHVAVNVYFGAVLTLFFLEADHAPNVFLTIMSLSIPVILALHWTSICLVLIVLNISEGTPSLFGAWEPIWTAITLVAAPWWLWNDTSERPGFPLIQISLDSHSAAKNQLRFGTLVLPLTIYLSSKICENIVITAASQGTTLRALTFYLVIPAVSRTGHLHMWTKSWLERTSGPWHRWYVSMTSLGKAGFLSERYIAPATHTAILWTLVYPILSLVRLLQGHPFGLKLPTLDIPRCIMMAMGLLSGLYLSARNNGKSLSLRVFM